MELCKKKKGKRKSFNIKENRQKSSQNFMRIINNFRLSKPQFSNKFAICQIYFIQQVSISFTLKNSFGNFDMVCFSNDWYTQSDK